MLSWKDFFDFSDDAPLKDGVQGIEQLEKVYQRMVAAVENSNQRIAADFAAVQQNAEQLLKTVNGLNMGIESNQKVLAASSSQSEDLVKEYSALKTVQAENLKQIQALQDQLDKLTAAKEKAKKATDGESGSFNDLRTRLAEAEKAYKAMGDATDKAVKDEQLEKVRGLAAEYKAVKGALDTTKKSADHVAGSYNELSARVAAAKKELKNMAGGLQGNTKEFKELQKFAAEGTAQLKEWDNAVGDNQRKVGDYAGEIGSLIPGFQGTAGAIGEATNASLAFMATPLGVFLLLIAGALAAVTAYFKGSAEGQDDLNKVMRAGEAVFEAFKDVVEVVGKVLFKAITEPKKTWEEFMTLVKPLGDAITEAFNNPVDAMKKFGQAILDNVWNRMVGVGKIFQAVGKIVKSGFTDGFKDLADAAIQSATGVKDGTDKIMKALEPITEEMNKRLALGQKIAALENRLRKERLADILDDAKTELQVNKLLTDAKDEVRFSDEERFNKLRKANTLLEEQLKGDLELQRAEIQLQKLIIQQSGDTYEARQKLVELQAKEIELQSQFEKQRKRRASEESSLVRQIEADMLASQKRIADADAALNAVRLNDAIDTSNRILADENATLEERLKAVFNMSEARQQLLEQDRDKQLAMSKEAALQRIDLDAETLEAIYNQDNLSIQERIALERQAKEELLSTDKAYQAETIRITEDFNNKTKDLLEDTNKSAEDNIFKILARDAENFASRLNTELNDQLTAVDTAFADGTLSMERWQAERDNIVKNGARVQLEAQLDHLEEELKLVQGNAQKRIAIEEQISKVRRDLAERTADEVLEHEQRLADAVHAIKEQAIAFAVESFHAESERNIEKFESDLALEEEKKNRSLAIVGEDAQAKAFIEQDFANKKKEIERQIAAEKRKQAVFDKAVNATEVTIATAKGVASAVAASPLTFGLPWSAFVAVTGALQLARILAAPIPQFFKGTMFSPEGPAWVAERGREFEVTPDGEWKLHEQKKVVNLERGSKIITNERTEAILRQAKLNEDVTWQKAISDDYKNSSDRIGQTTIFDTREMAAAMDAMKREVVAAIMSMPQDVYDEHGHRRYERTIAGRVHRLDNRTKLQ